MNALDNMGGRLVAPQQSDAVNLSSDKHPSRISAQKVDSHRKEATMTAARTFGRLRSSHPKQQPTNKQLM
jgi:hypothetical protein